MLKYAAPMRDRLRHVNLPTLDAPPHLFCTHPYTRVEQAVTPIRISFQAAFTGSILLIAANVGAIRDHAQAGRIEHLTNESEQPATQNRDLVQRLLNIEQLLDEHINSSLQAHTTELRELGGLVRAVHAAVCVPDGNGAAPAGSSDAVPAAVVVTVAPSTAPTVTSEAEKIAPAQRSRRQSRSRTV